MTNEKEIIEVFFQFLRDQGKGVAAALVVNFYTEAKAKVYGSLKKYLKDIDPGDYICLLGVLFEQMVHPNDNNWIDISIKWQHYYYDNYGKY